MAETVLVTGGGGFLGSAICRQLLERGYQVRSFQRRPADGLKALGAEVVQGDLCDREALVRAMKGVSGVFHVAAKAGVWGDEEEYYQINVRGTAHVLYGVKKWGISKLVYTSTPSVTFDGKDQRGVDEACPYPEHYLNAYQRTKAEAEKLVMLAAEGGLHAVVLRPHLIWGPFDTQLIPRIVERAKAGRLRLVGDGEQEVDSVYIDNAAYAHLLAYERIEDLRGRVFFVTNQEPMPFKVLLNKILTAMGQASVEKKISYRKAYQLGALCEKAYGLLRSQKEPPMTRFVAAQLGTAHWYSPKRARTELGYKPLVSIAEGLERLQQCHRSGWLS